MLFFSVSAHAAPGINETISFQGRLLTSAGTPVPDGYYNIEFKIYEGGSGTAAGNPDGSLAWTEDHINNGNNEGVKVTNGYMSVALGSKTPFGNSVDWNDNTIWLSMNIAGLDASCSTFNAGNCTADGEMTPMKRLTAAPYAMNAGKLGGKTANDFIHNGTDQQTGNFNLNGTGIANVLQGNSSVLGPVFDRANSGALSIGSTNATTIQVGSAAGNQAINIGTGTGNKLVAIGSTSGDSALSLQGGTGGVAVTTGGSFSVSNGTSQLLTLSNEGNITAVGNASFDGTVTSKDGLAAVSQNGNETATLTWNGGNSTAYIASTGNTVAIQGGGVNLITAVNDNGVAKIGIGNAADSGYALDVTGGANVSDSYAINGTTILNSTGINFGGTTTSTIAAADGQTLNLASDTNVTIGDGNAETEATLLRLDRSENTPTGTGDALLGSMYYDTVLGKVQCYEADGWGACSSSPDVFVSLSPEYSNAVTNGSGIGSMTSDICSDTLNINDASNGTPICGLNETYNFYNWTSPEATAQTKSVYVTYQLPANFTKFVEGSTSLMGRVDNGTDADVSYEIYKNTATGLVACGTNQSITGAIAWEKIEADTGSDPANCGFVGGESIVFKINLTATDNANAYISTLNFAFSNN